MTKQDYLILRQDPYSDGKIGPLLFNYAVSNNNYKESYETFVGVISRLFQVITIFEHSMIKELVTRAIDHFDTKFNITLIIKGDKQIGIIA